MPGYEALDVKALASAGLGNIENARAVYQAARAVNNEPGVVQRATRLLGQLEGVPRFWEAAAQLRWTGKPANATLGRAFS